MNCKFNCITVNFDSIRHGISLYSEGGQKDALLRRATVLRLLSPYPRNTATQCKKAKVYISKYCSAVAFIRGLKTSDKGELSTVNKFLKSNIG